MIDTRIIGLGIGTVIINIVELYIIVFYIIIPAIAKLREMGII